MITLTDKEIKAFSLFLDKNRAECQNIYLYKNNIFSINGHVMFIKKIDYDKNKTMIWDGKQFIDSVLPNEKAIDYLLGLRFIYNDVETIGLDLKLLTQLKQAFQWTTKKTIINMSFIDETSPVLLENETEYRALLMPYKI